MPYTTVVAGQTITASWGNANVRDQTIVPFASASARTSAVTSPIEGMLSRQNDIKAWVGYDGAGWNDVIPGNVIARKTSDQSVNNSTTLVNDSQLAWAVVASAVYKLEAHLLTNSGTTPDFKIGWTVPTGASMTWGLLGNDTSLAVVNAGSYNESSQPGLGGSGSDLWFHLWGQVTVASTAGTLQLQFAQNTANASNSTMRQTSYGILTRIA